MPQNYRIPILIFSNALIIISYGCAMVVMLPLFNDYFREGQPLPSLLSRFYSNFAIFESNSLQEFALGLPGLNLLGNQMFPVGQGLASDLLFFFPPIVLALIFCYVFVRIINRLNVKFIWVFVLSLIVHWFFARYFAIYAMLISLAQTTTEIDSLGREVKTIFAFTPRVMLLSFTNYSVTFAYVGFWSWFAFWRKTKKLT